MSNTEKYSKGSAIILAVSYLIVPGESLLFEWVIFGLVFLVIGLPHGALDHLIYVNKEKSKNKSGFFSTYLFVIFIYFILWILFPVFSLIIFLIISAYHFGQVHFIHSRLTKLSPLLFFSLGAFYLSVILWSDFAATTAILAKIIEIEGISRLGIYFISIFFTVSILQILVLNPARKFYLIMEMLVLGSLLYQLPLLLSFVLYFGFWHSFPSLEAEYKSLTEGLKNGKISWFIQKILPFSLISIIGISVLLLISINWLSEKENVLLFFIVVSLISAPHIYVMDGFLKSR